MVDIIAFLFAVALPIGFLTWTLRFKGLLALITIAPVLLLNVTIAFLNTGASQASPPEFSYTHNVIANVTTTVSGNVTTAVNNYASITDHYPIPFIYMALTNSGIGLFTLVTLFVVWRRVTREPPDDRGKQA